jgi:hypothetical protein
VFAVYYMALQRVFRLICLQFWSTAFNDLERLCCGEAFCLAPATVAAGLYRPADCFGTSKMACPY